MFEYQVLRSMFNSLVITAETVQLIATSNIAFKRQNNVNQCYRSRCTVPPLLSGHPWGFEKWPLSRGWPLNRGTI